MPEQIEADAKSRAQVARLSSPVQPGQRYRHFKGGEYEIVTTAIVEATGEEVVVYRSLESGFVWVRPAADWGTPVACLGGGFAPRFALVRE